MHVATTRSRKGIEQLLDQAGVEFLHGHAKVTEANAIEVSGEDAGTVEAKNIVIATGSSTRDLPNIACDGGMILSSRDLLNLDHVPESLLIIGGGSIGVEFASIFGTFGSKVTIVELLANLLPMESTIVGHTMEKILKRRGIEIHANVAVSDIDISGKDCCAHVSSSTRVVAPASASPTRRSGMSEPSRRSRPTAIGMCIASLSGCPGVGGTVCSKSSAKVLAWEL